MAVVVDVLSQSMASDTRNVNVKSLHATTLASDQSGRMEPTPGRQVLDSCDIAGTNANTTVSVDSRIGFDLEKSYPVADKTTQVEDVV